MKNNPLILAFILFLNLTNYAQGQNDSLKLKDLAMPISPAFSLLDQAPTVIDRPATATALGLHLFQTIDQKTGLPSNYAAEFTPFWFVKHPKMSFFKFFGTDEKGNRRYTTPQPLRTTLSVAFVNPAQATTVDQSNIVTSSLSYGGKMSLFRLNRKNDLEDLRKQTGVVVAGLSKFNEKLEKAAPIELLISNPSEYKKLVREFLKLDKDSIFNVYKSDKVDLSEILNRKPLASVDFAFASNVYFPNKTVSNGRVGRTGLWLTANMAAQIKDKTTTNYHYISIYLIGRQMWDNSIIDTTNAKYLDLSYSDFGGKLEFESLNFVLSYELVSRTVTGDDKENNPFVGNGLRSVGNIRYRISSSTSITGAFGKNFGRRDNLLYTFGINWNISNGNEQLNIPSQ